MLLTENNPKVFYILYYQMLLYNYLYKQGEYIYELCLKDLTFRLILPSLPINNNNKYILPIIKVNFLNESYLEDYYDYELELIYFLNKIPNLIINIININYEGNIISINEIV